MIPAAFRQLPGVSRVLQLATWIQRRHFDWSNNVRTMGDVALDQLEPVSGSTQHSNHYHPTHPKAAREMLRTLPITDYSRYTFVDLGSGKGLMLFAAAEFPFARIEGVEFSKNLHDTAVDNIANYRSSRRRCSNIVSKNIDATQYSFPNDPLVIFLFNPFRHQVLERVLTNLDESLRACPRDVIVLYLSPFDAYLFERMKHIAPWGNTDRADVLAFRSVPPHSD